MDSHQITLGATTRFIDQNGMERFTGTIAQRFYVSDRKVLKESQFTNSSALNDSSDLFLSGSAAITKYLKANLDYQYNIDENMTNRATLNARYKPRPGKHIDASYRLIGNPASNAYDIKQINIASIKKYTCQKSMLFRQKTHMFLNVDNKDVIIILLVLLCLYQYFNRNSFEGYAGGILNDIIEGVEKLNFMNGNWFDYKDQKVFVTRSGYTGEDGFEVSINNNLAEGVTQILMEKGAQLIGLGARDTLRLEAGLCLYGHELDTEKTPIEANLKWAISKERISNGGFVGSDKIMKEIQEGTSKIRIGIKPEGRLIAREKTKIFDESEKLIGEVTSGTFGPSVNGPIAMGYIDKEFSKVDTKILLEVRGKKHPASVCGLPFYKKSYVKGVN